MTHSFQINEIVKGVVCGEFVILGFRTISGEDYAQLKPHNMGKLGRGEIALPITSIRKA